MPRAAASASPATGTGSGDLEASTSRALRSTIKSTLSAAPRAKR